MPRRSGRDSGSEKMPNIQVTHDTDLNNARSESAILANPSNPQQIVASSKKFRNIQNYDFTLATSFSPDGRHTWHDSADVPTPDWDMLSDRLGKRVPGGPARK